MRKVVIAILAISALLATGVVPLAVKHRRQVHRQQCLNNLRQIMASTESCALAFGWQRGDAVNKDVIARYLRDGIPRCPSGGRYIIPPLGAEPTCSFHGNLLKIAGDVR